MSDFLVVKPQREEDKLMASFHHTRSSHHHRDIGLGESFHSAATDASGVTTAWSVSTLKESDSKKPNNVATAAQRLQNNFSAALQIDPFEEDGDFEQADQYDFDDHQSDKDNSKEGDNCSRGQVSMASAPALSICHSGNDTASKDASVPMQLESLRQSFLNLEEDISSKLYDKDAYISNLEQQLASLSNPQKKGAGQTLSSAHHSMPSLEWAAFEDDSGCGASAFSSPSPGRNIRRGRKKRPKRRGSTGDVAETSMIKAKPTSSPKRGKKPKRRGSTGDVAETELLESAPPASPRRRRKLQQKLSAGDVPEPEVLQTTKTTLTSPASPKSSKRSSLGSLYLSPWRNPLTLGRSSTQSSSTELDQLNPKATNNKPSRKVKEKRRGSEGGISSTTKANKPKKFKRRGSTGNLNEKITRNRTSKTTCNAFEQMQSSLSLLLNDKQSDFFDLPAPPLTTREARTKSKSPPPQKKRSSSSKSSSQNLSTTQTVSSLSCGGSGETTLSVPKTPEQQHFKSLRSKLEALQNQIQQQHQLPEAQDKSKAHYISSNQMHHSLPNLDSSDLRLGSLAKDPPPPPQDDKWYASLPHIGDTGFWDDDDDDDDASPKSDIVEPKKLQPPQQRTPQPTGKVIVPISPRSPRKCLSSPRSPFSPRKRLVSPNGNGAKPSETLAVTVISPALSPLQQYLAKGERRHFNMIEPPDLEEEKPQEEESERSQHTPEQDGKEEKGSSSRSSDDKAEPSFDQALVRPEIQEQDGKEEKGSSSRSSDDKAEPSFDQALVRPEIQATTSFFFLKNDTETGQLQEYKQAQEQTHSIISQSLSSKAGSNTEGNDKSLSSLSKPSSLEVEEKNDPQIVLPALKDGSSVSFKGCETSLACSENDDSSDDSISLGSSSYNGEKKKLKHPLSPSHGPRRNLHGSMSCLHGSRNSMSSTEVLKPASARSLLVSDNEEEFSKSSSLPLLVSDDSSSDGSWSDAGSSAAPLEAKRKNERQLVKDLGLGASSGSKQKQKHPLSPSHGPRRNPPGSTSCLYGSRSSMSSTEVLNPASARSLLVSDDEEESSRSSSDSGKLSSKTVDALALSPRGQRKPKASSKTSASASKLASTDQSLVHTNKQKVKGTTADRIGKRIKSNSMSQKPGRKNRLSKVSDAAHLQQYLAQTDGEPIPGVSLRAISGAQGKIKRRGSTGTLQKLSKQKKKRSRSTSREPLEKKKNRARSLSQGKLKKKRNRSTSRGPLDSKSSAGETGVETKRRSRSLSQGRLAKQKRNRSTSRGPLKKKKDAARSSSRKSRVERDTQDQKDASTKHRSRSLSQRPLKGRGQKVKNANRYSKLDDQEETREDISTAEPPDCQNESLSEKRRCRSLSQRRLKDRAGKKEKKSRSSSQRGSKTRTAGGGERKQKKPKAQLEPEGKKTLKKMHSAPAFESEASRFEGGGMVLNDELKSSNENVDKKKHRRSRSLSLGRFTNRLNSTRKERKAKEESKSGEMKDIHNEAKIADKGLARVDSSELQAIAKKVNKAIISSKAPSDDTQKCGTKAVENETTNQKDEKKQARSLSLGRLKMRKTSTKEDNKDSKRTSNPKENPEKKQGIQLLSLGRFVSQSRTKEKKSGEDGIQKDSPKVKDCQERRNGGTEEVGETGYLDLNDTLTNELTKADMEKKQDESTSLPQRQVSRKSSAGALVKKMYKMLRSNKKFNKNESTDDQQNEADGTRKASSKAVKTTHIREQGTIPDIEGKWKSPLSSE